MSDIIFHLPPDIVREPELLSMAQAVDWSHDFVGVPQAWKLSRGKGAVVAVLDTGADSNHPDLEGQFIATRSFVGDGNPLDRNGHGTHVAGTIGAWDNQTGVVGIAPECKLLSGKVLSDGGSGGDSGIAAGIRWAVEQKAHIISMSLGSSSPAPRIHEAIKEAVDLGCIVIAAAGNEGPREGTTGYPGSYPEVVSVGAIGQDGRLTSFSSRGKVDVAAPGYQILSTVPGGKYARMSGTSMATPLVAGCAALVVGYCLANNIAVPTPKEFLKMLLGASLDRAAPGKDTGFGWGIIDPAFLIGEKTPGPPPKES